MERVWASALFRLPEEKEETYMPDFDVGNPEFQDLLEWVDQPSPTQARDTHALHFVLEGMGRVDRLIYAGLMFFHPGSPTAPNFEQQPASAGSPGHFWTRLTARSFLHSYRQKRGPTTSLFRSRCASGLPKSLRHYPFFRLQLPDFPENRCVLRNSTGSTLMSYPTHRL